MLFASLQIQEKTSLAISIDSLPDQATWHFANELLTTGEDPEKWAAELQRNS